MKFLEFVYTVTRMREAQRNFYARRTQSALIEAKALEREVDQAIRNVIDELDQVPDGRQMALDLDQMTASARPDIRRVATSGNIHPVDEQLERKGNS